MCPYVISFPMQIECTIFGNPLSVLSLFAARIKPITSFFLTLVLETPVYQNIAAYLYLANNHDQV